MKRNVPKNMSYAIVFGLALFATQLHAQDQRQAAEITKGYDLKKLKKLEKEFAYKTVIEKQKALEAAKRNGWSEFILNKDGSKDELIALTPDGFPLYNSVNNRDAAISTRANFLNTGGALGLNLNGEGMVARVWDGGKVRTTHQEFGGRVTVNDDVAGPDGNSSHSTHVTGTIAAAGQNALAKGMAPLATVRTFNWGNDRAEALVEVQQGMLLSNHSYGTPIQNTDTGVFIPSWYIGAYVSVSRDWDEVAYSAPYYLMVASAGNNGNTANPDPSTPAYDKLTGNKTSKNNLVVANAQDAIIGPDGSLVGVLINSSSSQGPADDLRIKPDITGNGTNLLSTWSTGDNMYGRLSGTSMAAPNVTGTLLLVQQHYHNITNRFMRAATLKALACHTADDAGRPGPDAIFGWGLLNAKKAVETITANGLQSLISEETLIQGQTFTMQVQSDGVNPLLASIVWADVPGVANNGVLNSLTPSLVNDLDLRLTQGENIFYPWKLQANATLNATNNSDNNVDNVERINVVAPAGTYTLTVTHKGVLQGGPQSFSLIVTGITSNFSITPTAPDLISCTTESPVYNFSYKQIGTGTTTFSAIGLPQGTTATFNNATLNATGLLTMTISGLENVAPGDYTFSIKGDDGVETESKEVTLKVYSSTFQPVTITAPANDLTTIGGSMSFVWNTTNNAESYRLELATDAAFATIVKTAETVESNALMVDLNPNTTYFWRVIPVNRCGEGVNTATTHNFKTGFFNCDHVFTATDFSNATIPATANSIATIPVTVTGGLTIGDLNVTVDITHTYVQDMTIYLVGPAAIGSPEIKLFQEACGSQDNIMCSLDDSGVEIVCGDNPGISGNVLPKEALNNFNQLVADGVWTLRVEDPYNGDGGIVNGFSLSICGVSDTPLSTKDHELSNVSIYPNPTKGVVNITLPQFLEQNAKLTLFDIQGRNILSKNVSQTEEVLNIENLQSGVYLLNIVNGNSKLTKKIILNK